MDDLRDDFHRELHDFTKWLSETLKDDPSSPSVIFSWLADKKSWYVSVVRYRAPFGDGKVVIAKAMKPTLEEAFREVLNQIHTMGDNP